MYFQNNNPYSGSNAYTVPNPSCPYNDAIPGGLSQGKTITIGGVVSPHADRLEYNLLTNQGNVALHINPRFHDNVNVRNSLVNGGWGSEERHGPLILQRGAPFELTILVQQDKYIVHINGHPAFHYQHRLPFQEVSRLELKGQQQIHRITYSGSLQPQGNEVHNPGLPFSMPILGGAQPGRLFQLRLVPGQGRFQINLQNGMSPQGSNDIHFHVSVRWDDPNSGGQPVVIRTNCQGGGWGSEDRFAPNFPFHQGQEAEVLILLDQQEWKMAVNGQHFVSMAHRMPFQTATHINVNGNVQLRSIRQF
jgi:hypothetical protein